MNNLPGNATQDMIDAQCAPIGMGTELCADCDESYPFASMYAWERYSWLHRRLERVYLCSHCVPRCLWNQDENGHVHLDLNTCGRIQSPNAQGSWCAEHEKEAEALDAAESEEA